MLSFVQAMDILANSLWIHMDTNLPPQSFLSYIKYDWGKQHLATLQFSLTSHVSDSLPGTDFYRNSQCRLLGYCDTDWTLQWHCHSTSGYIFMVNGSVVSWSSKKQPIVVLSTTKVEYIAATHAAMEALWIHMFIVEIAWPLSSPTILKCDNQSAICVTKNDQYHSHTKHIWYSIPFHSGHDAEREYFPQVLSYGPQCGWPIHKSATSIEAWASCHFDGTAHSLRGGVSIYGLYKHTHGYIR